MDSRPFPYHSKRLGRQMPLRHLTCLNINGGHIFDVKRMDVRRVMLRKYIRMMIPQNLDNTGIDETSCL